VNVIIICTDSMRPDCLGCYGGRVHTPNIDRLAAEGAIFDHAYSENLPTLPTRTAWWTGRYLFPFRGWEPLANSDYTLAEVLWSRGYTSALIADTYHMHKPIYNYGRGFDTVVWVRGQEYDDWVVDDGRPIDLNATHRLRGDESDALWEPRFRQYMLNTSDFRTEEDYFVARVVKEAIAWLERTTQRQKDNLFLWVDCFDPHEPWDPPEPYRSMYDPGGPGQLLMDPVPGPVDGYMTPQEVARTKGLYEGEIAFVDKWLGVLLDRIRELGLYDNTLIMHTADHGEPFGEHGIIRKARPWMFQELVSIPWIIRHPNGLGAGKRISALVQTVDMMPTILDFLGIPGPFELPFLAPRRGEDAFPQDMPIASRRVELTGKSLLPLVRGEVDQIRNYAFSGQNSEQWSIRDERWSLLLPMDGQPRMLFDRQVDPKEQTNIASEQPEVADRLELALRRFAASLRQ